LDKSKSPARYSLLGENIFLIQTDTTVGFLSQQKDLLDTLKQRPSQKSYLINFFSFKELKNFLRIPVKYKNQIRRAKKTTYVVQNHAFRVAKPLTTSSLLLDLKWCYSTSANKSGYSFCPTFAKKNADIIIENSFGLKELASSHIYKINTKKKIKLR